MEMISLLDFEEFSKKHLQRNTWIFYSQGAEREETLRENLRSFTRYRLIPRMLRNVPVRDMTVTVLGEKLSFPLGIAPTAHQKFAHPDGELAAASAAADTGIIYTLSTISNTPVEDVAKVVSGASPLWMQIYVMKNRRNTENLIKKVEAFGYKALVLTVDTPVKGLQHRLWRDPLKLPPHIKRVNITKDAESSAISRLETSSLPEICPTLTWDDVAWIKSISNLPIVLKGILTVEDAEKACSMGVKAVWVSNHGGRQLDGVDAAIDVLPAISTALSGTDCEVYMDGGVRWGTDILKALALGAKAVFIGRPTLWGLAYSGKEGVQKVIGILKSELDRAMHLAGCKDIQDIGPHLIRKNIESRL